MVTVPRKDADSAVVLQRNGEAHRA
jgi:hypothetical protein